MSESKSIAREIARTLKEEPKGKTSPYDTTATVNRIEGGTAWVQIPGGVDETPVQLTVNAKEGDSVQVRVSGGKAWITGNGTNPPTDDKKAIEANENAIYAQTIAENAEGSARRASLAAEVAEAKAQAASVAADEAWEKADDAETSAGQAQTSAQTANSYANGALTGLSTVQDVIGMLNWAQENASYSLTQDTDIVPGKTYWTRSGAGTEADPYVYTPVVNPVKTDLNIYYEITGVEEAMGDFINAHLALTEEGLWILPDGMDAASYRVLIATGGQGHTYEEAGTYIIDAAGKTVAKLGEIITLGIDDGTQSYMRLDYHSTEMFDKENSINGKPYFHISDLRNREGKHYVSDKWVVDDEFPTSCWLSFKPSDDFYNARYSRWEYPVKVNGVDVPRANVERQSARFWFLDYSLHEGDIVTCDYYSDNVDCKAFTFGTRDPDSNIGSYSVSFGIQNKVSGRGAFSEGNYNQSIGFYSHTEGSSNIAYQNDSHAEGTETQALGESSHAEGYLCVANAIGAHAEGWNTRAGNAGGHSEGRDTYAKGTSAHAEGEGSVARGNNSHSQNYYTIASKDNQTVIGKYNEEDTESDPQKQKALIIGNGTDDDNRSNALTVDWQGNVWTAGTVTENNGTRDIDLNISEATIQKYVNLGMSLT